VAFLVGWIVLGGAAWALQLRDGMQVTALTDQVPWGAYIANFTFAVGLAAGGVMMVIPAYLYHHGPMHDVVIVGELLAIAAIAVSLGFVVVDLGRPDRVWHMLPALGRLNFPQSVLTWDMVVLSGYLLINLHVSGYLLCQRYLGRQPERRWYLPFVLVSIVWAFSVHAVTAFLYAGLGARPFWNSALLAPRFLTSAFITGPALIVLTLRLAERHLALPVPEPAVGLLLRILRVTTLVNLIMVASELFTEFYTRGSHTASGHYLFVGLHGHRELVPWSWAAIALNSAAVVVLLTPSLSARRWLLHAALAMTFVGVWIEKGMGLIVPGFIPSALGEIVPYSPSLNEFLVCAGVWSGGALLFTALLRVAVPVEFGSLRLAPTPRGDP
jgi:molybdopterin-containing oxidoreductase family membrane subunit